MDWYPDAGQHHAANPDHGSLSDAHWGPLLMQELTCHHVSGIAQAFKGCRGHSCTGLLRVSGPAHTSCSIYNGHFHRFIIYVLIKLVLKSTPEDMFIDFRKRGVGRKRETSISCLLYAP